jgi:hypothetical protein
MGRSHTAVLPALMGLLALEPGCQARKCERVPPDQDDVETGKGEPPVMLEGRFIEPDVVELAFSEALAPVDAVDPEKFRLGMVTLVTEKHRGQCSRRVSYCEVSTEIDDEYGCGYGGYSYGPEEDATRVTSLELDQDDASRLRLRITPPIEQAVCLRLEYAEISAAGIHAFFSAADEPTIEDKHGDKLEDIAPHWVIFGAPIDTEEDFEALEHWQPIPCPDHF